MMKAIPAKARFIKLFSLKTSNIVGPSVYFLPEIFLLAITLCSCIWVSFVCLFDKLLLFHEG